MTKGSADGSDVWQIGPLIKFAFPNPIKFEFEF